MALENLITHYVPLIVTDEESMDAWCGVPWGKTWVRKNWAVDADPGWEWKIGCMLPVDEPVYDGRNIVNSIQRHAAMIDPVSVNCINCRKALVIRGMYGTLPERPSMVYPGVHGMHQQFVAMEREIIAEYRRRKEIRCQL